MKAPLFDDIISISTNIANASTNDDDNAREEHYKELIKLCAANENSPKDHPLQWEALANFTLDSEQAIDIYQKGVACAERMSLPDNTASIFLEMALRYQEMEEQEKSKEIATKLSELLEQVTNDHLINDINDFLKSI